MGLEPTVSWSEVRRLIHWATAPIFDVPPYKSGMATTIFVVGILSIDSHSLWLWVGIQPTEVSGDVVYVAYDGVDVWYWLIYMSMLMCELYNILNWYVNIWRVVYQSYVYMGRLYRCRRGEQCGGCCIVLWCYCIIEVQSYYLLYRYNRYKGIMMTTS